MCTVLTLLMPKNVKYRLIFYDKEYRKMYEIILSDFFTYND